MPVFQAAPSLHVEYTHDDAAWLLQQRDVLAVLGAQLGLPNTSVGMDESGSGRDPRGFELGLRVLVNADHPWRQVLRSQRPVQRMAVSGVPVATDGNYLFTSIAVGADGPLADATTDAYVRLLLAVQQLGFPHLIRMWNYVPAINDGEGDQERYRQFCLGRYAAFARAARVPTYPAASALGCADGCAHIALLASRYPAAAIENPNQVSAFRYPRQYGPASPSFARASLLPTDAGELLFVSGTAAIAGHASMHEGDAAAQLLTSLANIETVVAAAEGPAVVLTQSGARVPQIQLRVYVRRDQDLPALRGALDAALRVPCTIEWLQADVCRRELLVEVEATMFWART